jgi:cytochrome c oxidase assembly protein subunit 11
VPLPRADARGSRLTQGGAAPECLHAWLRAHAAELAWHPACTAPAARRVATSAAVAARLPLAAPSRELRRGFAASPSLPPPPPGGSSSSRGATLAAAARARAGTRSAPLAAYLAALTVGMVGATYASVPLYRMFCQATGFGGTTQRVATVEDKIAAHAAPGDAAASAAATREVVVTFNADVADAMPWRFFPAQRQVVVRPGESTLAFFTAHNTGDAPVTGVSTYNVSPMRAGLYFNKIQCFCFEARFDPHALLRRAASHATRGEQEQRLLPGEKIDMPVLFYLVRACAACSRCRLRAALTRRRAQDPEFATDPRCAGIRTLTLSYCFFRVDGAPENAAAARAALQAAASRDIAAAADAEEAGQAAVAAAAGR